MSKFSNRKQKKHQNNFDRDNPKNIAKKKYKNQNVVKEINNNNHENDLGDLVSNPLLIQTNNERNTHTFLDEEKVDIKQTSKDNFYEQATQETLGNTEQNTDLEESNKDTCNQSKNAPYELEQIILETYQEKEYKECIAKLTELLQIEPNNKKIAYWLGMSHFQENKYKEAVKYYTEASSSTFVEDVVCVEAFFWLGEIYRREKQLRLASDRYQQFLQLAPQSLYAAAALQHLSQIKLELLCDR